MAAKLFQTRTEEEIEQLLRFNEVLTFMKKLLGFVTFCNKVVS